MHKVDLVTEVIPTAKSMTAIPLTAARLWFGAATVFLVLLATLHVIKPELEPS
jgi:hypothetical protein